MSMKILAFEPIIIMDGVKTKIDSGSISIRPVLLDAIELRFSISTILPKQPPKNPVTLSLVIDDIIKTLDSLFNAYQIEATQINNTLTYDYKIIGKWT